MNFSDALFNSINITIVNNLAWEESGRRRSYRFKLWL